MARRISIGLIVLLAAALLARICGVVLGSLGMMRTSIGNCSEDYLSFVSSASSRAAIEPRGKLLF